MPFRLDAFGTHQPLLVAALTSTTGPVVELGAGWYSTPVVHAFACMQRRPALTIETGASVYEKMRTFAGGPHELDLWPGFDFDATGRFRRDPAVSHDTYRAMQHDHLATFDARGFGSPSVVLVDHSPGILRDPAIAWFADRAEYIVVHDAHPHGIDHYRLTSLVAMTSRWTMTSLHPQTAIASNRHDCSRFAEMERPAARVV